MTVFNLPIENLEERYSSQWNIGFPKEFEALHVPYVTVYPDSYEDGWIKNGQFLDVVQTNIFKSLQMAQLLHHINLGEIKDGDVLFFHDLWNPCLEMLFYVRDGLGVDFKIAGLLHAGTYDPCDFLTQKGMGRWAALIEKAWCTEVDAIFMATQAHHDLLLNSGRVSQPPNKIYISGFPLFQQPEDVPLEEKKNIVVFPHRLAPEKGTLDFDLLKAACSPHLPGWEFIRTKDVCQNKQEYYSLLRRSKIAVSCALQETWGIAQQEALFHGCLPVVPSRLSYKEMYHQRYQYQTLEQARNKIIHFAKNYDWLVKEFAFLNTVNRCAIRSDQAITNMVMIMRQQEWHV